MKYRDSALRSQLTNAINHNRNEMVSVWTATCML